MKPVFVMVGEGRPSTSSLDARDRCASRNDNVGVTRASTTVDTTLRQQDGCRPHIRGLEMQIETRKVYDTLVVEMSGRLDSRTAGDAGDRMVAIAQGTDRRVVLNLEKLQYVSSAGLRVILQAAKLLQAKHGKLTICSAGGSVTTVLETAGFDSLLNIYATEKEAVAALST
jgi:anti-anti-sigma factor